jgi:hypothetical protein
MPLKATKVKIKNTNLSTQVPKTKKETNRFSENRMAWT